MRRAVARGRILPQSLSTDPRYGRLSLKAQVLYPLMWINCDDQGRLPGDPDEIKYAACPSVREITADDIPDLLQQMETKGMIRVYSTSKTQAIQMLDWWEVQRLQWAYPSEYPPPEGWQDKLRYHASPTQIVKENWPLKASNSLPKELPNALPKERGKKTKSAQGPLSSPPKKTKEENERGRGKEEEGRSPSALGSTPPSPRASPSESEILARLTSCFQQGWGHIKASAPDKIIPRRASAKETAQLRDVAKEISSAGGCPLDYIDQAFSEAAGQQKMHISYARAVLLAWLGIEKVHPP